MKEENLFLELIKKHKNDKIKNIIDSDNINFCLVNSIYEAVQCDNVPAFELLKNKINIYESDLDLLFQAAAYEANDIFEVLILDDKFIKTENDYDLMERVVEDNNMILVDLMIKSKIYDFSTQNNRLIHEANYEGFHYIVDLLWQQKSIINTLKNDFPELFNNIMKIEVIDKVKSF